MSLFAELQRRNVIRMAGLYLVGAWLLVQVASTLLPAFDVPGWALRGLVIVLALGFVPALAFSWVFEITPDGLKRDVDIAPGTSIAPRTGQRMNRLIVAMVLLAMVYFLVDKFVLAPRRDAVLVQTTARTVKAEAVTEARQQQDRRKSIAVLPFVNMSADAGNQFFADGISEELLNVLVRVDGLGVASRTSSFAYKGSELGAQAIARELKVGYILEGSVRKEGKRVRITAQLIDGADDRHLWSETYDRELNDIFAIQDEIAKAIVLALRGSLAAVDPLPKISVSADTDNMQAYELYLKAREIFIARGDLLESVRLFERVVALDPKFARGWEGLSAACSVMRSWGHVDRDYDVLAEQAANTALSLDPSLSMPWATLGQTHKGTWPVAWELSLAKFDKAVAADPRNATAVLWRGMVWIELGYFDRAIAEFDRCLALEPGYHNCRAHKSLALLLRGDEDAAFALLEEGIAGGFYMSRAENFVGALVARGNRTGALLLLDATGVSPALRQPIIARLAGEGPRPDAKALVAAHAAGRKDVLAQTLGLSWLYLWLGDYDMAGRSDDDQTSAISVWERHAADFRNSPGMKMKLQRMGVPAYWRANGFPPQCRAVGKEDFSCD